MSTRSDRSQPPERAPPLTIWVVKNGVWKFARPIQYSRFCGLKAALLLHSHGSAPPIHGARTSNPPSAVALNLRETPAGHAPNARPEFGLTHGDCRIRVAVGKPKPAHSEQRLPVPEAGAPRHPALYTNRRTVSCRRRAGERGVALRSPPPSKVTPGFSALHLWKILACREDFSRSAAVCAEHQPQQLGRGRRPRFQRVPARIRGRCGWSSADTAALHGLRLRRSAFLPLSPVFGAGGRAEVRPWNSGGGAEHRRDGKQRRGSRVEVRPKNGRGRNGA